MGHAPLGSYVLPSLVRCPAGKVIWAAASRTTAGSRARSEHRRDVPRPGDRVFFEPGEEHWHGAAANRFMTHLAMLDVDEEGASATWGTHVRDVEYAAAQTA